MNPAPRVLVGITTKNRAAILPKAVESALAQDYPNLEVAVLDDGSTDTTPALRGRFPAVTWLRNEESLGIIRSRNRLMERADADFYVSLDDDAWFLKGDEISIAVRLLASTPSIAAIAFDILSPDRPAPCPRGNPAPVAMFIGCGHVLRLSAARRAGLYAPTPGAYGSEEKDLSLRLADLDQQVVLLPGVHVWHDKAWGGRDNGPLHRSGVCNEMIMTLRRCPAPDVVAVIPLKAVSYALFWLRNPGYTKSGLAGLGDFVRHLGSGWSTRQPVRRSTFYRSGKPVA